MPRSPRVCDSQHFILGPAIRELETGVAAYCQTAHGIGVSSGTDALLLALMALDIGSGDEVITSSYTFFATGGTIARAGARPVFLDIDPVSYNLSPALVRSFLEDNCERRKGQIVNRATGGVVRALMPVHLYGQLADMDALMPIAREYDLQVIEDAAQAIGAADARGDRACSFGDIGCLSFFPTKNLGAFGDAGMCVTNDAGLAQRMAILRVHGMEPKYYHALHRRQLPHRRDPGRGAEREAQGAGQLDRRPPAQRALLRRGVRARRAGRQGGNTASRRPACATSTTSTSSVPNVAMRCVRYLAEQGVGSEVYYPVPLHQQQCFAYLGYKTGELPESERASAETLALPIFPELATEQLQHVVDCIARFYQT